MNNGIVNFAVVGVGRIGKVHIENLVFRMPDAAVVSVSDVFEEELKKVAGKFKIGKTDTDYKKIVNDKDVDAVVICSPTDTHTEVIEAAAEAGKHIFCEKPIDLSVEKIVEVNALIKKCGVKFFVGFNRRFDPNFARVHEVVNSGGIGKPHILNISSRDPAPPPLEYLKVSGGMFLDMTIHDFDMARFLMQSEVEEIYARGEVLVDDIFKQADDIDTAVVSLSFKNGSVGTINNSRQAVYGYDQRVEVFGSQGMVTIKNNTPDNHILVDKQGTHSSLPLNFFMDRYTQSYLNEMTAFVECIREDKDPPVTGNDGLQAVIIGLAAKKSVEENRPVNTAEIALS
jgi:myo-inositol 2-dehydrogenase/D-chiro-inositol 1-dehydrogenase